MMTTEDKDDMSEDNEEKKATRQPKRNSIPQAEVRALIEGLPSYEKTSFTVVGHRDGKRLAIPKTAGVSRVYYYGEDDYSSVPAHEAIITYSAEDRKAGHRGGIMAEVDFGKGLDLARSALEALVAVVRAAEPPTKATAKLEKALRKAKAAPKTETKIEVLENGAVIFDDGDGTVDLKEPDQA